ncbi:MAG: DUF4339 domain-containing protein, partial [Rhodobacteraceae bacterium]
WGWGWAWPLYWARGAFSGGGGGGGAPPPPPPPASEPMWHIAENGQTRGPIPQSQLAAQISRDTLVWTEGQSGWLKAGEVPALTGLFAPQPPPPPPPAG